MQVPVIQRAGLLSVMDIALRLQELQLMAEEGRLHQEDLAGMTLTILLHQQHLHSEFDELTEHLQSLEHTMPGGSGAAGVLR